jgi:G3E family GTPase
MHYPLCSSICNPIIRQIAAADVLLLNKSDLAPEFDLRKTESLLRQLNPSIPIYRTVRGQIDLSKVMGIGAYGDKSRTFLESLARSESDERHEACSDHEHGHQHEEHESLGARHAGISSLLVRIPRPLTESQVSALDQWIRTVLWEGTIPLDATSLTSLGIRLPPSYSLSSTEDLNSAMGALSVLNPGLEDMKNPNPDLDVLRCKGIWWNERGEQFVLQGVRSLYDVSKIPAEKKEEEMAGKLVFIGKGLNKAVEDSLKRVVASSNS